MLPHVSALLETAAELLSYEPGLPEIFKEMSVLRAFFWRRLLGHQLSPETELLMHCDLLAQDITSDFMGQFGLVL